MRCFRLFLYVLLFVATRAYTQEYSYTQYDTRNGLPSSTIYGLVQSKDGFIWMGTENGLCRFDGVHFKAYTNADGLPANDILGLYIDSRSRIWMMPFKAAICYYDGGKIHNQQNDPILKKILLHSMPRAIAESDKGDIIIMEEDYTHIIAPDSQVHTFPEGYRATPERSRHTTFRLIGQTNRLPLSFVRIPPAIVRQANSGSRYSGLRLIRGKQYHFFSNMNEVHVIGETDSWSKPLAYKAGYFVIISDTLIFLHSRKKGAELYHADHFKSGIRYFPDHFINYVMQDQEQNLWFGTKGAGLFKISANRFRNLFAAHENGATYIRQIHRIGDNIYIAGLNKGYWKTNPVDDQFFRSNIHNTPEPVFSNNQLLHRIPSNILIHSSGSDFFNLTRFGYGELFFPKTIQVFGDTLLTASHEGTFLFDIEKGKMLKVLYGERATCAYRYDGVYYIGTLNGLYMLTSDGSPRFLGTQFPVFTNEISTFAAGADGTLWVGTNGGGIVGYRHGRICAVFNTQNGLASAACRCLYTEGNTLWAGTDKGLNKIDVSPGRYQVIATITANDGLNSNIINTVYCDSNFVYTGTPLGVTVFDECNIRKSGISYINMTGITVSGRDLDPRQAEILLSHQDNNISFEYSGISYLSEATITYKYRMLGLSDQWKTTREHILTYPSLPSGSYTLELIAINKYGNESPLLVRHFKIEKALVETLGFKLVFVLLLIIFVIFIIYLFIRRQHKKVMKKMTIQQKINSLEQMALRAQMNPHFIFNCLNSMQEYILEGDVKKANFYLSRFAALVRDTFNNATKVYITLEQELNYLTAYIDLERMKQSESFDYQIQVGEQIVPKTVKIPNMVLQPYVENAIKHGINMAASRGKLTIAFNLINEKMLECIIEDNGPGIEHSKKNKVATSKSLSRSMSITDQRIITLNQIIPESQPIRLQVVDKSYESKEAGTRIIIHFPI